MHKTDNPMLSLRGKQWNRWVACTEQGVFLGEVSGEDLAAALEECARAIRSGSAELTEFPPKTTFRNVPCRWRRSSQPKLDQAKGEIPV